MKLSATIFGKTFNFGVESESLADQKSLSPDMQAFVAGTDLDINDSAQGTKFTTAYAQSAWVYTAISSLSTQIARIPFRISRVGTDRSKRIRALRGTSDPKSRAFIRRSLNENVIDSGPVVELFNNPHPSMDANLFWEMVVTWHCLRGEFFILPMDSDDQPVDLSLRKPNVERLITLPPELFWHMVAGWTLEAWRYTGSPLLTPIPSEILLPSEVIHSRSPNPYLYWRGMSPLIVADIACKTDYAGEQYIKGLWINNADTGVIVTTDQQCDPQQRAAILAALRERKRKAGTADRPLFLWGGAKVEKPNLSSLDMQYLETRKFLRKEIQAIFKVPDTIMGFSDDKASALSGGGQAISAEQLQFVQGPVSGHTNAIEVAINRMINAIDPTLIGWFDVESLPIMQEARRARIDTAAKAFSIGVPFNDANEVYDLGFPKYPWGNKSFLPFNLQEVTAAGLGNQAQPSEDDPSDPGAPKPGEGGSEHDDENPEHEETPPEEKPGAKNIVNQAINFFTSITSTLSTPSIQLRKPNVEALWNHHMNMRKSRVNLFKSKVSKVLLEFRKKTLAKLNEIHLEKSAGRIVEQRGLIDLIFNAGEFGKALNDELQTPIKELLQNAGAECNDEIQTDPDDAWKYPPKALLEYLAERKQRIEKIGDTVRDQLSDQLKEAADAGETHDQIVDRIRTKFTSLSKFEADRIARTEVNIGYNTARHQAMTDAGIEFKAWLSSHGPNVRPAHEAAEIKYIDNPIPIDEPFRVMGEDLMFPGDDSLGASAGNIINCQCIQLAAVKKSETEKSIIYLVFGSGEMEFMKEAA